MCTSKRLLFVVLALCVTAFTRPAWSDVSANFSFTSSEYEHETVQSWPSLNAGGSDWEPFGPLIAHPHSGKSIKVLFTADNGGVFSLTNLPGSVVTLDPGEGGERTCLYQMNFIEPGVDVSSLIPSGGDLTSVCFFSIKNDGSSAIVYIQYYGKLTVGQPVHYTISDLAAGAHDFINFDSAAVIVPDPIPSSVGRISVRMALALDKSGSMAWSSNPSRPGCNTHLPPTDPDCLPDRWTVLKEAFAALISVADTYKMPGDQFAVVTFDDDIDDPEDIITAAAAGSAAYIDITGANLSGALVQINAKTPSGSTSIGAAVKTLVDGNDAGSGGDVEDPLSNAEYRNVLLLFTDGAQNRSPFVERKPLVEPNVLHLLSVPGPGSDTLPTPQTETNQAAFNFCPFAMVADDPAGFGPIADIADIGCNNFYYLAPSMEAENPVVMQYLIDVLNQTMLGDKLETVSRVSGSLNAPATAAEAPTVLTADFGANAIAVTFLLKWAHPGNGVQDLVLRKDGVEFSLAGTPGGMEVRRGSTYLNLTVRKPFCNATASCVNPAGQWELSLRPIFEVAQTFDYSLLVVEDNSTVATEFQVSQTAAGVGKPLLLEAKIFDAGNPVAGLPAGAVRAVVKRPDAGMGNILSDARVDMPSPAQMPDNIQLSGVKFNEMLQNSEYREQALAALVADNQETVVLTETSPGHYSAEFTDTPVEGIYEIEFLLEATGPSNGFFKRTRSQTYLIPVVPSASATLASATYQSLSNCSGFKGGCAQMTFKPVDDFGNRMGPGKAFGFWLTGFDGDRIGEIEDHLDGHYTIRYGCHSAANCNPLLGFSKFSVGKLAEPQATDPLVKFLYANLWWLLLVLLLLLIALVLLIRRRP